jgi:hypothetical protein
MKRRVYITLAVLIISAFVAGLMIGLHYGKEMALLPW